MNSTLQNISDRELLETMYEEITSLKQTLNYYPQWIPIYLVAEEMQLSNRQMYKRVVESGIYEEGKHYKKIGNDVCVNKKIIHTLRRKRKQKATA